MGNSRTDLEHLIQILKTLKNINRIIAGETDLEALCNSICNELINNKGYFNAWIILTENGKPVQPHFYKGFENEFHLMTDLLNKNEIPKCVVIAINCLQLEIIENPKVDFLDCPLSNNYLNRCGFSRAMRKNGKLLGWICVSIPEKFAYDKEEQDIFNDIVNEISYAIENLIIKDQKNTLEANCKIILDNTIYDIFPSLEREQLSKAIKKSETEG